MTASAGDNYTICLNKQTYNFKSLLHPPANLTVEQIRDIVKNCPLLQELASIEIQEAEGRIKAWMEKHGIASVNKPKLKEGNITLHEQKYEKILIDSCSKSSI